MSLREEGLCMADAAICPQGNTMSSAPDSCSDDYAKAQERLRPVIDRLSDAKGPAIILPPALAELRHSRTDPLMHNKDFFQELHA